MTFLAIVSSPLPSSYLYPAFFLNSATKINFKSGVSSLKGVTRGGPPPSLWCHWVRRQFFSRGGRRM